MLDEPTFRKKCCGGADTLSSYTLYVSPLSVPPLCQEAPSAQPPVYVFCSTTPRKCSWTSYVTPFARPSVVIAVVVGVVAHDTLSFGALHGSSQSSPESDAATSTH